MPMPHAQDPQAENPIVEGVEWDINAPVSASTFSPLPTDIYQMTITDARVEEDRRFGQPDAQGRYPRKLVLIWEVTALTPEQEEAGVSLGEKVWHRLTPTLNDNPNGGPSKFKAFVNSLREQTKPDGSPLLPDRFTVQDFMGITQRVSVEQYINQNGKDSNKVTAVAPLRVARRSQSPAAAASTGRPPVARQASDGGQRPSGSARPGPQSQAQVAFAADDDELPF